MLKAYIPAGYFLLDKQGVVYRKSIVAVNIGSAFVYINVPLSSSTHVAFSPHFPEAPAAEAFITASDDTEACGSTEAPANINAAAAKTAIIFFIIISSFHFSFFT